MNLTGWATNAWADGSWVPESWGEGGTPEGMVLEHWVDNAWEAGSWVPESWGVVAAQPVAAPVAGGGKSRRRRSFVELDGQLVEVSGYEEAERLLTELKKEEKAQEKARKKLRISLGKVQDSPVGLYAEQKKIEALERQMDDRADRIAQLYIMIQNALEEDITEDDEEVLMLS